MLCTRCGLTFGPFYVRGKTLLEFKAGTYWARGASSHPIPVGWEHNPKNECKPK